MTVSMLVFKAQHDGDIGAY